MASSSFFSSAFNTCWKWVAFLMAEKIGNSLVYSLSMALLFFSLWTLHHRPQSTTINRRLWLICSYIMVLMATTQFALNLVDAVLKLAILERTLGDGPSAAGREANCAVDPYAPDGGARAVEIAQHFLFAVNVTFTDGIFIFRCWLLWNKRWAIIALPALLLVATTVTGIIEALEIPINGSLPFIFGAATNIILIAFSAWRIVIVRRRARILETTGLQTRYGTVLAVIGESGALYCIVALLLVITQSFDQGRNLAFCFVLGTASHTVNIIPTIAIVRSGLGYSSENIATQMDSEKLVSSSSV
ncbi:hypothetical protein HMN09_00863000 [Mycena chlorophos]|uniref:Uncharacterized protein n=1 Tax=Mycena chlorophos TaxID=658473 RepID=A0A8H6W9X7_MYCCL|nr:hypothetical protein HMN09_00863000 [Mycena chlorophos]